MITELMQIPDCSSKKTAQNRVAPRNKVSVFHARFDLNQTKANKIFNHKETKNITFTLRIFIK
jgi:hypothetical protein